MNGPRRRERGRRDGSGRVSLRSGDTVHLVRRCDVASGPGSRAARDRPTHPRVLGRVRALPAFVLVDAALLVGVPRPRRASRPGRDARGACSASSRGADGRTARGKPRARAESAAARERDRRARAPASADIGRGWRGSGAADARRLVTFEDGGAQVSNRSAFARKRSRGGERVRENVMSDVVRLHTPPRAGGKNEQRHALRVARQSERRSARRPGASGCVRATRRKGTGLATRPRPRRVARRRGSRGCFDSEEISRETRRDAISRVWIAPGTYCDHAGAPPYADRSSASARPR